MELRWIRRWILIMIGLNQITNRGIKLSYDIGNSLSYPGTGTTITDLYRSGINLTNSGSPVYINSNWGILLWPGNSTSYGHTNNSTLSPASGDVSYGVLFKMVNVSSGPVIFSYYAGARGSSNNISLYSNSDGTLHFYIRDQSSNVCQFSTSTSYSDGNWHYASLSYSASPKTITCYVDGKFVGTSTNASMSGFTFFATDTFGMAGDGLNTTQYFNGYISSLHYYLTALTAQEVLLNYQYLIKRIKG